MVYRVAVAGASGYAGGELVRLLAAHPDLEVVSVTANSNAGRTIASVHPHLASVDLKLLETNSETLYGHDVVFLALHTAHPEPSAILLTPAWLSIVVRIIG